MQFFKKYRQLFEIPNNTPIPKNPLKLQSNLFINKPYLPSYQESYQLNSKIKALKKDYDSFENEVIQKQIITPYKKSNLRKRNESSSKQKQQQLQFFKSNQYNQSKLKLRKKQLLQDDMQNNIIKHSQIDYLFNHQIHNGPSAQNVLPTTINRGQQENPFEKKKSSFTIRKKTHPIVQHDIKIQSKAQFQYKKQSINAVQRRQKAKQKLNDRRQKLKNQLKTMW